MMFFSTSCLFSENIKRNLERLINAGVRNIELSSSERCLFNVADFFARIKEKYVLNFLIHNYFPPPREKFVLNLASQNRIILGMTLNHCKGAIRLAGRVKAPVYSVHSGMRLDPHPTELGKPIRQSSVVSYDTAYNTLVQSLIILCDYARNFNVEISVENHVLAPFNLNNGRNELLLMCESDEFLQLFQDVKRDNLKVLVDLGHLKVTSMTLGFDKVDFIDKLKDKISVFHLSDNNGLEDTHGMIGEESWFWDVLSSFRGANCVIESHKLTMEQIKLSKQICREKLS